MAGWTTNSRVGTEKMGAAVVLLTEFLDSFGDGANRPVVCYIELNNFGSDVVVLLKFLGCFVGTATSEDAIEA